MSRTLRHALFALGAAILVLAAAGFSYVSIMRHLSQQAASRSAVPAIGGPFTLTDQAGQRVSDDDLRGKLMLVSFGYTYCPDVCPTILSTIGDALDALGPQAEAVRPVFITIDPARDTPKVLSDYVRHFHRGFIGLTGTADEIAGVAKAYRVYYAKATPHGGQSEGAADYLMDHSTVVYLMGRDGRLLTTMSHKTAPREMAETIRRHL